SRTNNKVIRGIFLNIAFGPQLRQTIDTLGTCGRILTRYLSHAILEEDCIAGHEYHLAVILLCNESQQLSHTNIDLPGKITIVLTPLHILGGSTMDDSIDLVLLNEVFNYTHRVCFSEIEVYMVGIIHPTTIGFVPTD